MLREAVEQELERAGWAVDHGFWGHLIIGSAENLSILAPCKDGQIVGAPEYELYDALRNVVCRVKAVPLPLRAQTLLEEHGEDAFAAN